MCEGVTAGKNRRMVGNVGQAHRAFARQWVFGGGDEIQGVVPHRYGAHQMMRLRSQSDYGDFRSAMEDFFVGYF
ncbi:hypothetical protein D3C84_1166660 [compost metagenome]